MMLADFKIKMFSRAGRIQLGAQLGLPNALGVQGPYKVLDDQLGLILGVGPLLLHTVVKLSAFTPRRQHRYIPKKSKLSSHTALLDHTYHCSSNFIILMSISRRVATKGMRLACQPQKGVQFEHQSDLILFSIVHVNQLHDACREHII